MSNAHLDSQTHSAPWGGEGMGLSFLAWPHTIVEENRNYF